MRSTIESAGDDYPQARAHRAIIDNSAERVRVHRPLRG
jgi:hypothetical protein